MKGMNKTYLDENIYYIENFFSQDLMSRIEQEMLDERPWDFPNQVGHWKDNIKHIGNESLIKEINDVLEYVIEPHKLCDDPMLQRIERYQRYQTGAEMGEHWDNNPEYGHGIYDLRYGMIIYLNDDFDGGELEYTKLGISIKPKKNMFVIHPGLEKYSHKVNKITFGTRYTMSSFLFNINK